MRGALLDTMAVLLACYQPERLSRKAGQRLLELDAGPVFYSAVSLWEIGLKMSVGGYRDVGICERWHEVIPNGLYEQGFERIEVEPRHCKVIENLPFHHRDPFDRMIFAQAIEEDLALVSSDRKAPLYLDEVIW